MPDDAIPIQSLPPKLAELKVLSDVELEPIMQKYLKQFEHVDATNPDENCTVMVPLRELEILLTASRYFQGFVDGQVKAYSES